MTVWKETWRADDLDVLGTHEHCTDYPVADVSGTALGPERAKLAAAAPDMARVLIALAEPKCAWCGAEEGDPCNTLGTGHHVGCIVGDVLNKAGALDWPADFNPLGRKAS